MLSYYDQYIEKIEHNKKYSYDIEVSRNFLLSKAEPYFDGAKEAKMTELAEWVKDSDKIITF